MSLQQFQGVHISGEYVATGKSMPSVDPSDGEVWADITVGDAETVDQAVRAARTAYAKTWSVTAPWERATVLRRLADLLVERTEELATVEMRDNGKPMEVVRGEIARGAEWLRFFAGAASTVYGNTIPLGPGLEARTYREPFGVVGAILPWNSPLYLYLWKIAPALSCGNTVVLKPSELASASSSLLADCAMDAGLPPGVLNIVSGDGAVGGALAAHPGIDKLTFTGSVPTGRVVAALAAENFTPATIEAGGKAPLVVLGDSDIASAVRIALRGAFRSAGQSCAQLSRILIEERVYDQFLDRLLDGVHALKIGPASDPAVDMGPVISETSLRRCMRYADIARSQGCRVCSGGGIATVPGHERGYYFEPTVLDGVDRSSELFQEEIFGPIVVAKSFSSDDEAIELANAVDFGLIACVMTKNVDRLQRFTRDLEVGVVCVNSYHPGHWLLPYGGRKASGMGIDNGYEVIGQYTRVKAVMQSTAEATD